MGNFTLIITFEICLKDAYQSMKRWRLLLLNSLIGGESLRIDNSVQTGGKGG